MASVIRLIGVPLEWNGSGFYLANERHVPRAPQNQALSAIKGLLREALINSPSKVRCQADGAQEMRHIIKDRQVSEHHPTQQIACVGN
ncbi:MAG: hypothetical protein ABL887_08905 [Nitrosomonas sp.]